MKPIKINKGVGLVGENQHKISLIGHGSLVLNEGIGHLCLTLFVNNETRFHSLPKPTRPLRVGMQPTNE